MIDVFDVGLGRHAEQRAGDERFGDAGAVRLQLRLPWAGWSSSRRAASTVSTYAINPDDTLTTIGSAADGQPAACWISMARGFYFVSNAGGANISTYALDSSGMPSVIGTPTAAAAGSIDSVATRDGRFLYQECGGAGEVLAYRIGTTAA